MAQSAAQLYAAFTDNADNDVALRLLRSPHAVAYLALMAARLGTGPVDAEELGDALTVDLQSLQSHFTERARPVPAGPDVLDSWVKAGYVSRTLDDTDREVIQLTRGATTALGQVQAVSLDRNVATETALELVTARLSAVAVTVSADPDDHLRALDQQIAELTQRREALRQGLIPEYDRDKVVDDLKIVSSLAERMPADILGYGEKLREHTRALLTHGLDASDSSEAEAYAKTLQRLFDGHDELANTPEGKAFDAFYTLLSDHRLRRQLETSVASVVHEVELPDDLRDSLTGFLDRMWMQVQRVDEIRGQVYRRINTFVKDGDFLQYQSLRARITEAQRAAVDAFDAASAGRDTGLAVPMSAVDTSSVGALRFHDGVVTLPPEVRETSGEFTIDPARLVGREAIDWDALAAAVNEAVGTSDGATLTDVLAAIDAPRAGDVVGVWSLGARYGTVDEDRLVTVVAHTQRGPREMTVPHVAFAAALPPLTPASAAPEPTTLFEQEA
ncbi:hypothetical protein AXK58_15585 [Tsukamurella tyrosinosolvens]|uniref:DUF3375 domain-containing protein n=1 Tax=Tsukamurella tyrosinosolvens TaxID=57704 RepID=A0A1H4T801_TSUTY|nr:DUF3375 domain-containing protein [Tsukamurella tyrosinosolvens]KXO93270.1 hypothetical protein AXK58_15585 [Tsukamurella tyrosinosolvens]KXP05952.1 hypothetical protein AXK59_10725 [Tsukamurella tyrosinosolvens]KZL95784.1 hypothetical protein AXX05_21815 [Tsukamurella tyrosinosolvens]MEC4614345.1 DUF3375 domain-containing protein [Tsukamurella tyrosinosolvens]RDB46608.1 DUF3375 domain-containing protein [Tsukamurella tyrosinosolvens]